VPHRVPPDFNWKLPLHKLYRTKSKHGKKFPAMPLHFLQISLYIIRIVDEAKWGEAGTNYWGLAVHKEPWGVNMLQTFWFLFSLPSFGGSNNCCVVYVFTCNNLWYNL